MVKAWASDIRQAQPDKWNSRSSRWHSSAGDERAWKYKGYESAIWDGSKWPAPTSRDLGGPDYDTDKEWQLCNMKHGEGWAHDPTFCHYKQAKPTQTDPEDDKNADPSLPVGSTSKTYNPRADMRSTIREWPATLLKPARLRMLSAASMNQMETQWEPGVTSLFIGGTPQARHS